MHLSRLVLLLTICICLSAYLSSFFGALLVQAIGLSELFPWLVFGRFQVDEKWKQDILDTSNDDAALISTHELIRRAGFDYENYYALSDDGYITQLIRIINPLADASHLRYPPVMVQHGQTANSRNFVLQSNRQHRPMPWPRPGLQLKLGAAWENAQSEGGFFNWASASEGATGASTAATTETTLTPNSPATSATTATTNDERSKISQSPLPAASSNRSLAFVLANNGFDVWLSSNRGVDENNQGFLGRVGAERLLSRRQIEAKRRNMTQGEFELMWKRTQASYWAYTLDDQIAHEMPSQILTVLEVTGARKISLVGYSNTAMTTLAMLSVRPDIARHVDATVSIAPVVYYSQLGGWFQWFAGELMSLIPKSLDAELFLSDRVADLLRRVLTRICTPISVRYTACKFLIDSVFGSSGQFVTNLELPFFGHMFRPTSWKCMAQHLQIIRTHRLAKFDYGSKLNRRYYGSERAPEYNISRIHPGVQVGLVAGDLDCWANPATLQEIRRNLARVPALDLQLKDYNHVDLTSAFDVDVRVNLPVLEFLNRRADVCERELLSEPPSSEPTAHHLRDPDDHQQGQEEPEPASDGRDDEADARFRPAPSQDEPGSRPALQDGNDLLAENQMDL